MKQSKVCVALLSITFLVAIYTTVQISGFGAIPVNDEELVLDDADKECITKSITKSIPLLTSQEIRDPEEALEWGIKGYVEVTLAQGTPTALSIEKGGQKTIPVLISFVSYVPEVTETIVTVDPESDDGLLIEAYYTLVDENGEVYEQGIINVNKLVTYNPSGNILVKSGQTVPLTLTIAIPATYPPGGVEFLPLGPVGIDTRYPLLGDFMVKIYA
jgi:hypothetical protein